MLRAHKMRCLFILSLLFIFHSTSTASIYPEPSGFVNDYEGIIPSSENQSLERILKEIKEKTGIEIAFVVMDVIPENQEISVYATELGHHWGVGQKGSDKGALILYKTGRSDGDRKIHLVTGYGLEEYISDAYAGRIRDDILIPYLRNGEVYKAFAYTALTIVEKVNPGTEITGSSGYSQVRRNSKKDSPGLFEIVIMIVIFLAMMSNRFGRSMLFGMLLGSMMGGRRSSWGGGGGSSFGGGFGGFGGGGFGGGGAGGSF